MSQKRFLLIPAFSLILVCFAGCDRLPFTFVRKVEVPSLEEAKRPFVTGIVVAKVNGYPITLEDLEEEVERYNSEIPPDQADQRITTPEQKLNYLKNELIQRILLYEEALNRRLDRDPEVQKVLEKTKIQMLVFQLMKEELGKINISSADIENYYNRLPAEYKKEPEERKLREVVVRSQAQAKDLLIRLLQGEDFSGLARQYSVSSSAKEGGDLGAVKPGDKFKEFDEAVFSGALDVGQVSNYFKGPDGYYYIVKVEAKFGGKQRSLSEMWDDLKTLLTISKQQEMVNDLVGNLSRNAKIEIEEDRI